MSPLVGQGLALICRSSKKTSVISLDWVLLLL
jgi:hypothetical protein